MHDLLHDFDSITPNVWMLNEEGWKDKLLKLPNWHKVRHIITSLLNFLVENGLSWHIFDLCLTF